MAKRTTNFTVTGKDGVKAFLLDVGMTPVPLVNGKGSIPLDTGVEHLLVWRFTGDAGAKLAIVGKVGEQTVVEVKESTIPPHRNHGAGVKPFTLE
jgi:hypothetical protein